MATEHLDVYGGPQARRSSLLTALAVAVVAIATVVAIIALRSDEPAPATRANAAPASYVEYSNARGGYAFAHPKEWHVSSDRSTTFLSAPKHDLMMSFGIAPAGSLRRSARELLASVATTYSDPAVRDVVQLDEIAGAQAIMVAGEGVNDAGIAINFTVTVIAGPEGNLGITVFTPSNSDPAAVLPDVQEVMASVELL